MLDLELGSAESSLGVPRASRYPSGFRLWRPLAVALSFVAVGAVASLVASQLGAFETSGLLVAAILFSASVLLGLRAPNALVGLYLFALAASPTVQLSGISVSAADPIGVGALVVTAIQARRRSANRAGIAAIGWVTLMLVSLIPPLLATNYYASQNLLRVLRMATVLVPVFLAGTISLPFAVVSRITLIGVTLGLISGLAQVYLGLNTAAADQYIYLPGGTIHRAAGIYGESSTFGDMGAICFLVAVLTLLYSGANRDRMLAIIAAPVGLLALVLGYSRSSLVFCLVGLGVVILMASGHRGRFTIPLALVAICGALTYLIEPRLIEAFMAQRLGLLSSSGLSAPVDLTSGRLTTWALVVSRFFDQPALWPLGIGYKMLALDPTNLIRYGPADNNYITVLVETGVIGFAAFMFWLSRFTEAVWLLVPSPLRTMCLALLAGVVVEALTADSFTYYRVIGILVLAYVSAAEKRRATS